MLMLHTSDIQPPTVSRISLCLIEGNPLFGQERACSTERCVHAKGTVGGGIEWYPAISQGKSVLKAPLCRVKPNSSRGSEESQPEVPFS